VTSSGIQVRTALYAVPVFIACCFPGVSVALQESQVSDSAYVADIDTWHKDRITSLKRPTGWLSLAGLYWLKEGVNTFGSDKANDVVFPQGNAPGYMGTVTVKNNIVSARIEPGIRVLSDGQPLKSARLATDGDGEPTVLSFGSLSWFVIERDGRFAIRLRDSENTTLLSFEGIERFPVDVAWRIPARFKVYDPPKSIPLPTVVGTISEATSPGALLFKIDGKEYTLDPLGEEGDDSLFLVFADETSGLETYGGGRFLYVPWPDKNGDTVIDFNRTYNPPCAFTPYATCPLPPEQNQLPVKVLAGEKTYQNGEH
jgi:uncharacterized protein (DUF1684 family)